MFGYLLFYVGLLLLYDVDGNIIFYDTFYLGHSNKCWKIIGNKNGSLVYKSYNIRDVQNNITISNYIQGSDSIINRNRNTNDKDLWYFTKSFLQTGSNNNNIGNSKLINPVCILQFTIMTVVGNFSKTNLNSGVPLIVIYSNTIENIYLPFIDYYQTKISQTGIIRFNIPLTRMLYLSNNSIIDDDAVKIALIHINSLSILGDFTRGNETVALDDVGLIC